jgi:tetratricopeptide (TPR) repeat protein
MYMGYFRKLSGTIVGALCFCALLTLALLGCREDEPGKPVVAAYTPRAYALRLNRGAITALRENKLVEALSLVERALEDDPDFHIAYNTKASILAGLGREAEGIAALERAIALRPDFGQAYLALGILLELGARSEEAGVRYGEAVAIFESRRDAATLTLEVGVNHAIAQYLLLGELSGTRSINEVLDKHPAYLEASIVKDNIKRDDREFFLRWGSKSRLLKDEEREGLLPEHSGDEQDGKGN